MMVKTILMLQFSQDRLLIFKPQRYGSLFSEGFKTSLIKTQEFLWNHLQITVHYIICYHLFYDLGFGLSATSISNNILFFS